MQDKNKITYDDYCFFTDCIRELATLQDNRLYILKQKVNRHIYNNTKLDEFFYARIAKYNDLIKDESFIQKCYKFRNYFYKCLPESYAKHQETCTIPVYHFFYRKELIRLLYKNFNSDCRPVTCITIGKHLRNLEKDKEIQNKIFKIKNDSNGLYDFVSTIINQFLYDDNFKKEAQTLFSKEEKEILYECLDFYLMSIERKDPDRDYNQSDCIVTHIYMKKVLHDIRNFIYRYLNTEKEAQKQYRLMYYETEIFKLNGKDFLTNSSALTYRLYSICNGETLTDNPKSISADVAKINANAEKIIYTKILHSEKDRITKETKYKLNNNIIFRDLFDEKKRKSVS